jgi:hypothetical protein
MHNDTQHNDYQQNGTPQNDIQQNATQQNDTQFYDTQYNKQQNNTPISKFIIKTLSSMMALSITIFRTIKLSIMVVIKVTFAIIAWFGLG